MHVPWSTPFDGPGDKWLIAAVVSGIRVHGHHIEAVLAERVETDSDLASPLLAPSVSEAINAVDQTLTSLGRPHGIEVTQQVATTIRSAFEAGLTPRVLLRLLRHAGRTEVGFWTLIVKVAPSMQDLDEWEQSGWPSDEMLDLLAALRSQVVR